VLEMTKLALNIHLSKQFDDNNNNVAVEENFQRRFSVNVWCGIFGDRMDINRIRDAIACVIKYFIDASVEKTFFFSCGSLFY
jgi:hypothetical protein